MLGQAQIEDFKDGSKEEIARETKGDSEMKTKHTPGPWLFRTAPTSAGLCHIVSAADWRGAFIYGDGLRKGIDDALPKAQELAANARLIAAAPDLLEALQHIEEYWNQDQNETAMADACWHAINTARAAIARATGEQL